MKIKIYKEKWKTVMFYKTDKNGKRKKIKTYKYSISNFGNVRNNITGRLLKIIINSRGYGTVHLYIDDERMDVTIHRLVGYAFLGHPLNSKKVINHINSKRNDNFFKNLEWCSQQQNIIESFSSKNGLSKKRLKYELKLIHKICSLLEEGIFKNKEICEKAGLEKTKLNYGLINEIKYRNVRYQWIINQYNFSKTIADHRKKQKEKEKLIYKICELLEKGMKVKEVMTELSLEDNRSNYDLVYRIKNHELHNNISKNFNF